MDTDETSESGSGAAPAASRAERALVERAKGGDRAALEELLALHEKRIYRFGLRMCGHEEDAREVLQETLLAAYRNIGAFRGDARLSTWLFQLARSFCLRGRRRREGEPARYDDVEAEHVRALPAEQPLGDAQAHARQVGEVLKAAIATLPPEHREALVLRDVEGLSAEEAAEIAGVEVGALKSRLHRGRMAVRQHLAAVLGEGDEASSCPELAQELSAYAAAEIDQAACAHIEAHLARCERCASACDGLKRTVSLCRALPGGDVPASVRAAVRSALRRAGTAESEGATQAGTAPTVVGAGGASRGP